MAGGQEFERAWFARFPEEPPPDLECFRTSVRADDTADDISRADRAAIERELDEHRSLLQVLRFKVEQEEFIESYLWDMLHGKGETHSGDNDVSPSDTTNSLNTSDIHTHGRFKTMPDPGVTQNGKPLQNPGSRDNSEHDLNSALKNNFLPGASKTTCPAGDMDIDSNLLTVDRDTVAPQPRIPTKGASFNCPSKPSVKPRIMVKSASISERSPTSTRKPIPAPRPSSREPVFKGRGSGEANHKHKLEKLVPGVDNSVNSVNKEAKHGGDSRTEYSGGYDPNKQMISDTATSRDLLENTNQKQEDKRVGYQTEHKNQADRAEISQAPDQPVPLMKKKDYQFCKQGSLTGDYLMETPTKNMASGNNGDPLEIPLIPVRPPKGKKLSLPSGILADLAHQHLSRQPSTDSEPPPPEEYEGLPSSDEEPIYYNISESIQKSFSFDSQKIYKSAQKEKRALERAARRLTQRITAREIGKDPPSEDSQEDSLEDALDEEMPPDRDRSESIFTVVVEEIGETDDSADLPGIPLKRDLSWRKRKSMLMAMGELEETDSLSSVEEIPVNIPSPMFEQDGTLQMRKWVVTSILASEQEYTTMLGVLKQYMNSFLAVSETCQPLIPKEDVYKIFFKIPDLCQIHTEFVKDLEPLADSWTDNTQIGQPFTSLLSRQLPVMKEYLKNYHHAVATIQKCSQENQQFQELAQEIKFPGLDEKPSLEELLHKPVVRVQRNTLVLHDLIKCTPPSHPDYDLLQKALRMAQDFLESFDSPNNSEKTDNHRYLVKNSFIVEKVGNQRKLRHVFLFNDVIACAKQKMGARNKIQFECKWIIPLTHVKVDIKVSAAEEKKLSENKQRDVRDLQHRVSHLKKELKHEVRKSRLSDKETRNWSFRGGSSTRNIDKIKKKLAEQETALLLASPNLVFRLRNKTNKVFTFLMTSDYERNDWRDTIKVLKGKLPTSGGTTFSIIDIQNQMNDTNNQPKMNDLGSFLMKEDVSVDDDNLSGALLITIHNLFGIKDICDTYCTMEVDNCGHFFMKAKTSVVCGSREPVWNEDFEVELDGAQTLRILCYRTSSGDADQLVGRCALELSRAWLRGDFQEKTIALNEEVSVTVSLRYATRAQTLKRLPSSVGGSVFGVSLAKITAREGNRIPILVKACVEEVCQRGLSEVGIYRVSGLNGEIQRLKKGFDKNVKGALPLLREVDIHVVTGIMKLYFRELPQPLFTEELYRNFLESMRLSDPESKKKCMVTLFKKLPEPNYATVMYMLDHLVGVAAQADKNKMSMHNLATVFGPTLLRPAVKDDETFTMESFAAGARDAMMQTGVLMYYMTLRKDGEAFSRPHTY